MPDIVVNTDSLKQYAQRLSSINSRIANVDWRMNSLYWKVGLLDLYNLIRADLLTSYSWRLVRCASYLSQTASDFETAEHIIRSRDPLHFRYPSGGVVTPALMTAEGDPGQKDNGAGLFDLGKRVHAEAVTIEPDQEKDDRSWFAKFINNDLKTSDSVLHGETGGEGSFLGAGTAWSVSGDLLYGEAGVKSKIGWKAKGEDDDGNWNPGNLGITVEGKATGAVAHGKAEGNIGYLYGSAEGSFITGAVSAKAKATLWDDGAFNPSFTVGLKGEGSVLHGEAKTGFGTDQFGVYKKAEGDVLHAEAGAEAGVGYLGEDEKGQPKYGVVAKGSAMASIAEGKVKGGVTIFGVDIDIGIKGYAGAIGVEGGYECTTSGVKTKIGGALAFGGELEVGVDWSDAKWVGEAFDAAGSFIGETYNTAKDFVTSAYDTAASVVQDPVGFATDAFQRAKDFGASAYDTIASVAEDPIGFASSTIEQVKDFGASAYNTAASTVDSVTDFLFGWL